MKSLTHSVTLVNGDTVNFKTDTSGDPGAFMKLEIVHSGMSIETALSEAKFSELMTAGNAVRVTARIG